ncbi:MAG TPA: hypothetical protein VGB92_25965 [Longimicrobium sp.]|jgi:hypothetical protein
MAERLSQLRRAGILRTLATMPGYRANERILHDVVADDEALPCTRDQIRTEMHWLGDQGYITLTSVAGVVLVGEITQTGLDYAENRGPTPPGLARPDAMR